MMTETAPVSTFGVMDQRLIFADQILLTGPSGFESSGTFPNQGSPMSEFAFRLQPIVHLVPKSAISSAIDFVRVLSDFVFDRLRLLSNGRLLFGRFLHDLVSFSSVRGSTARECSRLFGLGPQ